MMRTLWTAKSRAALLSAAIGILGAIVVVGIDHAAANPTPAIERAALTAVSRVAAEAIATSLAPTVRAAVKAELSPVQLELAGLRAQAQSASQRLDVLEHLPPVPSYP